MDILNKARNAIRSWVNPNKNNRESSTTIDGDRSTILDLWHLSMHKNKDVKQTRIHDNELYDIAMTSNAISISIKAINNQLFRGTIRHGFIYKPKVDNPDESQKDKISDFFRQVNKNNQTFIDILRQFERDINILDIGFIILIKSYTMNDNGDILDWQVNEILRGDPIGMEIVVDSNGLYGGNEWICLEHRNVIMNEEGVCSVCGKKVFSVFYKGSKNERYIEGEVIHATRNSASPYRGESPIVSIFTMARTLLNMENYINTYYDHMRIPRGLLSIGSSNPQSVRKSIQEMQLKVKNDPFYIPMMAFDAGTGGGKVDFIRFDAKLEEMQIIKMREDYYRHIGAAWGVMPIFQGDITTSGGLNNEGLQITVTNSAVESCQATYHSNVFLRIMEAFKITDWDILLQPSDEEDMMSKLVRQNQVLKNAESLQKMGFEIWFDDSGELQHNNRIENVDTRTPMRRSKGDEFVDNVNDTIDDILREFNRAMYRIEVLDSPSPNERRIILEESIDDVVKKIESSIIDDLVEAYKDGLGYSGVTLQPYDRFKIENFFTNDILSQAYKGVDKSLTNRLNEIILKDGLGLRDMVLQMREVATIENHRLKNIARTETHHISMVGREEGFKRVDPEGKDLYKWIGPTDHRRTNICAEITKRTRNGVTLQELHTIMDEEIEKAKDRGELPYDFYNRGLTPHFQCRHVVVRAI